MAPKTAKSKKAIGVVDLEAPKKGRGKAKDFDVEELPEIEIPEKKAKRSKKVINMSNDTEQTNGTDKSAPTAKKARKEKIPTPDIEIDEEESDKPETNGENGAEKNEEEAIISKGKKKPKKAVAETNKARGKKNTNQDEKINLDSDEVAELQVKTKGRKQAPKVDKRANNDDRAEGENGSHSEEIQDDKQATVQEKETKVKKSSKKGYKAPVKVEDAEEKITPNNSEEEVDDNEKVSKVQKKESKTKKPTKKNLKQNKAPAHDDDDIAEELPTNSGEEMDEENKLAEPQKKETKAKNTKKGKKGALPEKKELDEEMLVDDAQEEKPEASQKKETKSKKNVKKQNKIPAQNNEMAEDSKKKAKKIENGQGDAEVPEANEGENVESKPAKGKRGQKKVAEVSEEINGGLEEDTQEEPTNKRRRKGAEENAPFADKKKAPLKNKANTNYDDIDFSNHSKNPQNKEWNFKISSWNVDGIRAWMNKGGLDYIKYEKPDILCLQEVKCAKEKLPNEIAEFPGYHAYWLCSEKDGYAGVGIYTKQLAMNVQYGLDNEELDDEGRIITAEYEDFYLICTYVPNAGRKLVTLPKRLKWNEEFKKHVKELDSKKPVIICGDMNVSHNEIDLANPKANRKNAGFTDEERAGMTELLSEGFVDIYRHRNPDTKGAYTFWTYMMNSRAKNVGWRLDYFIMSERLVSAVCDTVIRDQVYGSDHCPLSLFLHITSAEKPKE